MSPSLESKAEKRRSVFLLWETLAISVHCSKSQRSYLEFARMFAEAMCIGIPHYKIFEGTGI